MTIQHSFLYINGWGKHGTDARIQEFSSGGGGGGGGSRSV